MIAKYPRTTTALLGVVLLLTGLAATRCASVLARRDTSLRADEANSRRLVTYALMPGEVLRLPISPGVTAIRVVVQAFRRGAPLGAADHLARCGGAGGAPLELALPGSQRRARSEDGKDFIGDPATFDVDVEGPEAPDLQLESISNADGVLVRLYGRESVPDSEARERRASRRASVREHLAAVAGELDWIDLGSSERAALTSVRWRKLAPLPSEGHPLRAVVVDLLPPMKVELDAEAPVGTASLAAGQSLTGLITGPNSIIVRASEPAARISLVTIGLESGERTSVGTGRLELSVAVGTSLAFAASAETRTRLAVFAVAPTAVKLSKPTSYFRVTPKLPALVQAGDAPLVLRVEALRPLSREQVEATLSLIVEVSLGSTLVTSRVAVATKAARFDRYSAGDEFVPSERTTFYVLVPAHEQATLRPSDDTADLIIAELDPATAERDFVTRRPTNWQAFGEAGQGQLQEAPRLPGMTARGDQRRELERVERPATSARFERDGRLFVPSTIRIPFQVTTAARGTLAIRLWSEHSADIEIRVDDGKPRRRAAGLANTLTTARVVHSDGESTLSLPLGDDLDVGRHVLSFVASGDTRVFVHLPWRKHHGARLASAWLTGDFDP